VARYRVFTPRFGRYRNIETYDLPENQQLGPDATAELAFASERFGSTSTFLRYRLSVGMAADIAGESYGKVSVGTSGRIKGDRVVDQRLDVAGFIASPPIAGIGRLVAATAVTLQDNVEDNELFDLGGQTGLRGFSVGEFQGTSFARANAEFRSTPVPIWFIRMGFIAFVDVGHAANAVSDLSAFADFGVGVRLLAPQTAEDLYRIDWAIPTRGANRGFPGRLSIGFQQAF
jgi:hemolysin activation/secretion protein